jgi:hypothetical protein
MLSIKGEHLDVKDVKNSHHFLDLHLTKNVTDFITNAGIRILQGLPKDNRYNNSDIVDGSIIGSSEIIANLLNQTTVVDY